MNNFKKLLASAMALTMVTSVVPMNVHAEKISVEAVCTSKEQDMVIELLNAIKKDIASVEGTDGKDATLETVLYTESIHWANLAELYGAGDSSNPGWTVTVSGMLEMTGKFYKEENENGYTIKQILAMGADCGNEDAAYLVNEEDSTGDRLTFAEAVSRLKTQIEELNDLYGDEGKYLAGIPGEEEYEGEVERKAKLDVLVNYKGNFSEDVQDNLDDLISTLDSMIAEYENEFSDDFVEKYVKALKDEPIYENGPTVEDVVDKGENFERGNLSKLEKFVENVKEDKNNTLKAIAKYERVSDDDEIASYIEDLEAIAEEIEEINDLLKTSNKVYRDFNKVLKYINLLTAEIVKTGDNFDEDAVEAALANIDSDAIAATKAFKEEVFDEFFEVEAVERASGNVSLRIRETEKARFLNEDDTAMKSEPMKALRTLLETNVDATEEQSYYDLLVGDRTAEIESLIDAVTTDLEGITLNTTLTTEEANKIIAAYNALNELKDKENATGYVMYLTKDEIKDIKKNETLINTLYLRLIINGEVVKDWWQFENGQWVFYDNGRTVSNKWVADANNNWFYAGENGVMLTNAWVWRDATSAYYVGEDGAMVYGPTTIDGYEIDANGLWHA